MVHEINLTSINQPNMNAKDVIYLSILLFVNISCSKDNTKNMFPSPDINIREERNITYMVDTLIIDTTMNTTFEGNMGVHDNRLLIDCFVRYIFLIQREKFPFERWASVEGQRKPR